MNQKFFKAESKRDYWTDQPITDAQLQLGAVMRIADATEKMAASYDKLRADRDYWKERCLRSEQRLDTERRRTAALRGVLKRKKGKAL